MIELIHPSNLLGTIVGLQMVVHEVRDTDREAQG
jgi:hypothetical protein